MMMLLIIIASNTPPSYIRVRAVVWAYGRGQTHTQRDTQTRVTTIHFASSTTHAKCNDISMTFRKKNTKRAQSQRLTVGGRTCVVKDDNNGTRDDLRQRADVYRVYTGGVSTAHVRPLTRNANY